MKFIFEPDDIIIGQEVLTNLKDKLIIGRASGDKELGYLRLPDGWMFIAGDKERLCKALNEVGSYPSAEYMQLILKRKLDAK